MCAGRVLNRFSKDLGFLDDIIPQPFSDYLSVSMMCWGHDLEAVQQTRWLIPTLLLVNPHFLHYVITHVASHIRTYVTLFAHSF